MGKEDDDTGWPRPHSTPRAQAARAAREQREAAALRANLRRRKSPTRAAATVTDTNVGEQDPTNQN